MSFLRGRSSYSSPTWFNDGEAVLSRDARNCLKEIGKVWIEQINKDEYISKSIKHILIEGHANSKRFSKTMNEEENFLKNLGLSQDRAYQATKFLIETVKSTINAKSKKFMLREMIVAQGKGSLELIKQDGIEDVVRSKRLEFKIILESKNGS